MSDKGEPKKKKTSKRAFVVDTCTLLHNRGAIHYLADHDDLYVPWPVIEELDKHKKGFDIINYNARECARIILNTMENGEGPTYYFGKGTGTLTMVRWEHVDDFPGEQDTNDDKILAITFALQKEGINVTLITQDLILLVKAKGVGVNAEPYNHDSIKDVSILENPIIEAVDVAELKSENKYLYSNMPIKLRNPQKNKDKKEGQSQIGIWRGDDCEIIERRPIGLTGIKARNLEQDFAVHIQMDPTIDVVAITGCPGSGKTILSLACAIAQKELYPDLFVARMIVDMENYSLGYLPGDLKDKTSPYFDPMRDALKEIKFESKMSKKEKEVCDKTGKYDILLDAGFKLFQLTTSRGRTLKNTRVIIDEAQNLTPFAVKTIITRGGAGTKFIFIGDINQIDMPGLTKEGNGLSYLIDRFRGQENFAFIDMPQSERSKLAEMADRLL